ncbi:hypothetical protein SEUBUCD646_0G02370 [Saccharomyces eubayanus]|uniref:Mannosyl-oligosaccharide glucosidase n=1 Tax=Saccharomyces eubayanus TaxID=1080349 RepID=A0ABN8VVI2_SACEU|nr:hypothetical protein SEUBUCD650_0G02380 [Saccharomyces eubayanus]CAI2019089.1 hypothetical protein SEUBUCD646_0G02370 [Saccharomyces eubayanus]
MFNSRLKLLRVFWVVANIALLVSGTVNVDKLEEFEEYQKFTNESLLWAPYRSNCYFGITPRYVNESPLVMGIMWFNSLNQDGLQSLRHFATPQDKLQKYGWEVYDPRIGGKEIFIDEKNNLNLTVYFVKSRNGENWSVRVHGEPLDPQLPSTASIVLYFSQNGGEIDGKSSLALIDQDGPNDLKFFGYSQELGEYDLTVRDNFGQYFNNPAHDTMEVAPGSDCSKTSHLSLQVPGSEVWKARDIFQSLVSDSIRDILETEDKQERPADLIPSILTIRNIYNFNPGNFHYVQKTFDLSKEGGFEFDTTYNKLETTQSISTREQITELITWSLNEINARFDKKFNFEQGSDLIGSVDDKRKFALETLSNLLGGIGYFHGKQLIDRETEFDESQFAEIKLLNAKEEGPFDLFTSIPSRGFFPRGFYWDEGFHLLQIMEYDFDLAFEILTSWFEMIEDDSGWIAREIILGDEARSKVPQEFQVQNPNIANPPTLLLAFSEMLSRAIEKIGDFDDVNNEQVMFNGKLSNFVTNNLEANSDLLTEYAKKIYPKLLRHYNWFKESQAGFIDEYAEIFEEEGIWDKIHKSEVYRWVGRTFTHCLPSGMDDYPRAQPPDVAELNVDALAWVGVMTRSMKQIAHVLKLTDDETKYAEIEHNVIENLDLLHWSEKDNCYCDISIDFEDEEIKEFVCHEGYISLLPFALKLIPKDSPKLGKIVALMSDSNKIFSEFGLLSLSRQDEYFGKDENYWRGPVWMNINYLCLDAMRYYYPEVTLGVAGEASDAKKLYQSLKTNLSNNVYKVWKEQGYCYENYSPVDGHGTGAEHFTGWTALVVNILGRF